MTNNGTPSRIDDLTQAIRAHEDQLRRRISESRQRLAVQTQEVECQQHAAVTIADEYRRKALTLAEAHIAFLERAHAEFISSVTPLVHELRELKAERALAEEEELAHDDITINVRVGQGAE